MGPGRSPTRSSDSRSSARSSRSRARALADPRPHESRARAARQRPRSSEFGELVSQRRSRRNRRPLRKPGIHPASASLAARAARCVRGNLRRDVFYVSVVACVYSRTRFACGPCAEAASITFAGIGVPCSHAALLGVDDSGRARNAPAEPTFRRGRNPRQRSPEPQVRARFARESDRRDYDEVDTRSGRDATRAHRVAGDRDPDRIRIGRRQIRAGILPRSARSRSHSELVVGTFLDASRRRIQRARRSTSSPTDRSTAFIANANSYRSRSTCRSVRSSPGFHGCRTLSHFSEGYAPARSSTVGAMKFGPGHLLGIRVLRESCAAKFATARRR